MSTKHNLPVSANDDSCCQHISLKGRRCHMLIDKNHRSLNGEKRSTLCAYHADRSRASSPAPDPEAIAAELLGSIEDFSTADEINLFLGNLVKQFARKRIARQDAVALAYLCQLLLNSLTPLRREEQEEQDNAAGEDLLNSLARSQAARLAEQQANETSQKEAIPTHRS
jgi:hypothetical protein